MVVMSHTLLTAILLTLFSEAAWTSSYTIGKKGDVVAEQWSESRSEWDPVVLFFGYIDDWAICEEYREIVNKNSGTKMRCVENR